MTETIAERRVIIGGVATRTLEVSGQGPTIVLLHGFSDSADTWRPVLAELAALNRHAVAVDLPGHGRAGALERPVFTTLDRFADALLADYASTSPIVLAGNSLGGLVALRAAVRDHSRLVSVAGLGPAGLAHTHRLRMVADLAKLLDPLLKVIDPIPLPQWLLARAHARTFERLTEGQAHPDGTAQYVSHLLDCHSLARLRADLIDLSNEGDADPLDLEAITVPVLLLWGRRDGLADIKGSGPVLKAVPVSRLVVLDAGHMPQHQLPEEVARLLAELPGSARGGPNARTQSTGA